MIFTFYSFKGGVGRSMALANLAELLFKRGLRVRMVDLDLEAPGLERYFDVRESVTPLADILTHRGMIDLLDSYRHYSELTLAASAATSQAQIASKDLATSVDELKVEPISRFIVPIYEQAANGGSLSLLPAGQRPEGQFKEYARRVLGFNWDEFFVRHGGELFFEWLRREIVSDVDVVLIDSRTGVTEMSGVSTHQLADVVVSFVAPNVQNLGGVVQMATSMSNPELISTARKNRELQLVFVPSRVAVDDEKQLLEFQRSYNTQLGHFFSPAFGFDEHDTFNDLKLPYVVSFAYNERVAGRERALPTEVDLLRAYQTIAERLAKLTPVDSRLYASYYSPAQRIARAAEVLYLSLNETEQMALRQVATRLVVAGTDADRAVGRLVRLGRDDIESLLAVIDKLADAGVIHVDHDAGKGEETELSWVDEDAITHWPRLVGWMTDDRTFLGWRQRIDEALKDWQLDPRDANLLSGSPLSAVSDWVTSRRADLMPSEIAFIERSDRAWGVASNQATDQVSRATAEWLALAPKPLPLTGRDKYTVFLSYRSASRLWALSLCDVLRMHGHTVFDQTELTPGDPPFRRIEALATSHSGILIWSNDSADSEWVRREYEAMEQTASNNPQFRFVPVVLEEIELPEFAQNRIFLDFHAYPDGPNGGELLRLLYAVVGQPLSPDATRFAAQQDEASQRAAHQVGAAVRNARPERLVQLFEQGGLPWQTSATLGCRAVEGLTKLGALEPAMAMVTTLEQRFPKALRPRRLHAIVLFRRARNGGAEAETDLAAAQDILGELYEAGERDPEMLGTYAATWMERYRRSGKRADLKTSRDLYAEAFESAPFDYYSGINAASNSVLMGTDADVAVGARFARQVQDIVGTRSQPGDYWKTATVAEAFLIRKQYPEAARLYRDAVAIAPAEMESHRSTWLQACSLMAKLQADAVERALIRQVFQHLPDCAGTS